MENINAIIRGESKRIYKNVQCTHGNIMWITDENGWSHLQTPSGEDAIKADFVKEVVGSSCCRYVSCRHCGKVLTEPERRKPGTISRPPVGWTLMEARN